MQCLTLMSLAYIRFSQDNVGRNRAHLDLHLSYILAYLILHLRIIRDLHLDFHLIIILGPHRMFFEHANTMWTKSPTTPHLRNVGAIFLGPKVPLGSLFLRLDIRNDKNHAKMANLLALMQFMKKPLHFPPLFHVIFPLQPHVILQ